MSQESQIFAGGAALSAWLVLLLSGFALGGAVHLLLVAALVLLYRAWRGSGL